MGDSSRNVALLNKYGLHARPASRIVGIASRYQSAVTLANAQGRTVNAKSIMEVLTLAAASGTALTVRAVGDDAEAAVAEIADLITSKFGED